MRDLAQGHRDGASRTRLRAHCLRPRHGVFRRGPSTCLYTLIHAAAERCAHGCFSGQGGYAGGRNTCRLRRIA